MRKIDYELQKKAHQFRIDNGIGSNEPINFRSLFHRLGIISVFKEMSEVFSGMSVKIGNNKFILINISNPIGRQNFTICHELYHLFVQEDFTIHRCNTGEFNKKDKPEYDADMFASYLLMPEEGVIDIIPSEELKKKNLITLPTFLKIEQYYSCSRTALLFRLDRLDLIDKEKYEEYRYNVSKEAVKLGFDPFLYLPGNKDQVVGDYGELAKKLFDSENISESHYANLMRDIGIDIDADIRNHDRS